MNSKKLAHCKIKYSATFGKHGTSEGMRVIFPLKIINCFDLEHDNTNFPTSQINDIITHLIKEDRKTYDPVVSEDTRASAFIHPQEFLNGLKSS